MANISKHERETKVLVLCDAFEALKRESEKKGIDLATLKAVIELANEDDRLNMFKKKIGEKSLYTKSKNSVYNKILDDIRQWGEDFKKEAVKVNKKAKTKMQNISEKLTDVEKIVIVLQEKNHELMKRLDNRIVTIERLEKERDVFAAEVARLREKYESG